MAFEHYRVPLRVHHGRRSIRLQGYDYTNPGAYFVTICAHRGSPLFGVVSHGLMRLSRAGCHARDCWLEIPCHFGGVKLDAFTVMPDHLHGIIVIDGGAQHAAPLHLTGCGRMTRGALGTIVRSFKAAVTKRINDMRGTPGRPVWQRNYFEHIIRDEAALARLRLYIATNPARGKGRQGNSVRGNR